MKKITCLFLIFIFCGSLRAQQLYCNFEDAKVIVFKTWSGILDTLAANPDTTGIDTTKFCARYLRSTEQYDNIKMITYNYLLDVNGYASASIHAPKIKVKLYTNMPPGSKVQLQLGSSTDDSYPSGIHSEYWATTKSMNKWEELEFTFSQIPSGSGVEITKIDKVILMFLPNSTAQYSVYFDDLKGPQLQSIGMEELSANENSVKQYPNPVKEEAIIRFSVSEPGPVSLKVYDLFGREISSVLNASLDVGDYSIPVNTSGLNSGIYICAVNVSGHLLSLRMVVDR